jgi:hypothetical protein
LLLCVYYSVKETARQQLFSVSAIIAAAPANVPEEAMLYATVTLRDASVAKLPCWRCCALL